MEYQSRQSVLDHLICSRFRPKYFKWVYHGEGTTGTSRSTTLHEDEDTYDHGMHEMLNDIFETEVGSGAEIHENASNNSTETNNNRCKFDDLVKEAEEKISRWKVHESSPEDEVSVPKKKASKILRWFPLKLRLQRLFMSSKLSNLMKWHHIERLKDGKVRHPVDALVWKNFDEKFPKFASDPRNVRLALSSDGFNPFRTMNVAHSIWPVFVIPYNLPPWLVMKQPNIILSLIIPGPKVPGNKIDVYLQPLIKELKELWEDGINTFDASTKQYFQFKAAVISTISNFPSYANLSGWSTKGEFACPVCGFNTDSKWLTYGRKWCYMCHGRWLPSDHPWRLDIRSFVGYNEFRNALVPPSGDEVLQQLDN